MTDAKAVSQYNYAVSICGPLPHVDGLPDTDQCPAGARVCMTVTNQKQGLEDRITRVTTLAGNVGHGDLNPEVSIGKQEDASKPGSSCNCAFDVGTS